MPVRDWLGHAAGRTPAMADLQGKIKKHER
jgi:hypothetical protein